MVCAASPAVAQDAATHGGSPVGRRGERDRSAEMNRAAEPAMRGVAPGACQAFVPVPQAMLIV